MLRFPLQLFEATECGNGYVEVGEECDCGLRAVSSCMWGDLFLWAPASLDYDASSHMSPVHVHACCRTATGSAVRSALSPTAPTAATGVAATIPAW